MKTISSAQVAIMLQRCMRTPEELLRFLGSSHAALKHINWAIAETGLPNRFIIGNISYFEGYKTSTESSYAITRRYRAPDVLEFNTQRFDEDFSGWQRLNLLKWRKEGLDRQHRFIAIDHLENSLSFLKRKGL